MKTLKQTSPRPMCDSNNPYEKLLGEAADQLPPALVAAHRVPLQAAGTVDVWGPERGLAKAIHRLFGYPTPGREQVVELTVERRGDEVHWRREFDGRPFTSVHRFDDRFLYERFGAVEIQFELSLQDRQLRYRSNSVRCAGIKVPAWLRPRIEADLAEAEQGWSVEVRVDGYLWGQICRYRAELSVR